MCRTTGGFDEHPVGRRLIFDTRISNSPGRFVIPSNFFSHTGITQLHSTRSTVSTIPRTKRFSPLFLIVFHSRNNNSHPLLLLLSPISLEDYTGYTV